MAEKVEDQIRTKLCNTMLDGLSGQINSSKVKSYATAYKAMFGAYDALAGDASDLETQVKTKLCSAILGSLSLSRGGSPNASSTESLAEAYNIMFGEYKS
jgi:hypothetical protein